MLAVNVAAWLLSLVDGNRPRRVTRASHEMLLAAWRPERLPDVDVFLPTCGEPLEVLENAYRHVARLSWSAPLTVWVLDDADSDHVRELADRHGFRYVVRPDRGHLKKAGNLNHALTLARGEVVAILDADFCPRPDFLAHLVPYLSDPKIGIVQSPQVFDTDASMTWLERAAGAAQEWFFRWLQPSRDANDAAICCGSNAIYRRSAIDEIGGFAKLDHSEDMYTGIALAERGHGTLYVPVQLAKGLSPDTLPAFVNQQYRWAMGNLHLLITRDTTARMPWRRRLSYWNGIISYILTSVNVFAAPLPPLVMMFFYPGEIRAWHVLPLLAPLWVWLVFLPSVSRTRWRAEVIRAQLMVSLAAGAAVWHTLRGRSAAWVPTGVKTRSPLARRINLVALVWLFLSTLLAWSGSAYAVGMYGWREHWAIVAYTGVTTYLALPLIRDLLTVFAGGRPARPRVPAHTGGIDWPEQLAVTLGLATIALVSTGWVDPMLPWS
ncbi:glycosyltransferase family 2 protein [Rhizohabitans arisaemae]|uniref:glycosyltransferase family 2 protein n=1 Tax=Rhizohabitans arisaemae TaxID=2720610 RepID=UPI0024B11302|nr:glycosyltransferase [Rhizohabitans arisaemae]